MALREAINPRQPTKDGIQSDRNSETKQGFPACASMIFGIQSSPSWGMGVPDYIIGVYQPVTCPEGCWSIIPTSGSSEKSVGSKRVTSQSTSQSADLAESVSLQPIDSKQWRGVREVEGARLESVCRGNLTEGSNPSLSARFRSKSLKTKIIYFQAEHCTA